ncbi:DUF86 domain-containing protein [Paenibacillus puldeungensis]|uniref:DUF86 domain-containing protein n=1 Tax=Paenibacillus puldeungensis TaxID=696536 RepID=A0ABW3RZ24_9BACL
MKNVKKSWRVTGEGDGIEPRYISEQIRNNQSVSETNPRRIRWENGVIDKLLNRSLKAMVGFRNIAVHDYRSIQIEIVQAIIENHIDDFVSL